MPKCKECNSEMTVQGFDDINQKYVCPNHCIFIDKADKVFTIFVCSALLLVAFIVLIW